jgi:hypothetical protein
MFFQCNVCGSSDLRISRLRGKDLIHLTVLHYPMRCWVCRGRSYLSILQVFRSWRDEKDRSRSPGGLKNTQFE